MWFLFIAVTASIAFLLGLLIGSRRLDFTDSLRLRSEQARQNAQGYNYQTNMRSIFDLVSLNSYVEVNPATMRGQAGTDTSRVACCHETLT